MWGAFYWENTQFAINLLAALTWLAVFWLYTDAWLVKRRLLALPLLFGWLLLALSFAADAIQVETDVFGSSFWSISPASWRPLIWRVVSYSLIIIGLILQGLEKKPLTGPVFPAPDQKPKVAPSSPASASPSSSGFTFAALALPIAAGVRPLLALIVSVLYFRRYIAGLERHLRPVAWSLLCLAVYELSRLSFLFRLTTHPVLYSAVRPYGVLWVITYLFLILAVLIAGRWVAGYLLKRLPTQLFLIFVLTTVLIFLVTTVTFTALLLRNVQQAALQSLNTDRAILEYAMASQKAEILADTKLLSVNPALSAALSQGDQMALQTVLQNFLQQKKTATIVAVDPNGRVIARGENPERVGDSLSDDPLLKRALRNEAVAAITARPGAFAPVVVVSSAVPVVLSGQIIGALQSGAILDNSFLAGLKSATGLDSAIYLPDVLSATTFTTRLEDPLLGLGTRLTPTDLAMDILQAGRTRLDSLTYFGQPYLASFSPLKGLDDAIIGILFIGAPEQVLVQAAASSLQLTFLVSSLLILLSIFPAYFLAGRLARQLH